MMIPNIDCSQARSILSDAAKMGTSVVMTGEVDKDFMALVVEREKGTSLLMKVEAACGKDAKLKAMAARESADSDPRTAMFRNQNMSQ